MLDEMQNSNPYGTPDTPEPRPSSFERKWRRLRLCSSILFVVAVAAGVISTVTRMMGMFNTIAVSETVETSQLTEGLSTAMSLTTITSIIAVVAFGVCFWATIMIWWTNGPRSRP